MKAEEYITKREEVITKFSKGFFEGNYLIDPTLHSVIEMLIRGADPYEIIEHLIINQQNTFKAMKDLVENSHVSPPFPTKRS